MSTRWASLFVLAALGCGSSPPPSRSPPPLSNRAPAPATNPATKATSDGRCDPLPEAGTPCGPEHSWCIISWGEPGGFSSALWCRDGRWEIEEEANLPRGE